MIMSSTDIDLSRLTAHFQPIVDLDLWRVAGVEALARSVEGDSIWPVLERAQNEGWYPELELPLIEIAIHEAGALPASLWCSLNLSATNVFHPDLPRLLQLDPNRGWGIEVLEHSERVSNHAEFQQRMRDLGCMMLIDDAGVGHSDEAQIRQLQPSIVKLDRLVMMNANFDPSGRKRLDSLINEARSSGALLLAEGIETAAQLTFAQELGCELAQGFYFSAAVPADQVAQSVAELEARLWFDAL